jgi:glutamine amidotransferase
VYSVNFVLSTPSSLWALRYPETNDLYVLDRPAAGSRLEAATARIHARSAALAEVGSVVLASEPMDDDPGWRALDPGELIEVDADRRITSTRPFAGLRHPLTHDDLDAHSAASQRPKIGQPSP